MTGGELPGVRHLRDLNERLHAGERLLLVAEARTVAGSYIGSCLPSRDIPAFAELYRQGRLPVDRLVTRTLALDEINEAMDALADARVLRQVVTF